jgi:hypothetical protein
MDDQQGNVIDGTARARQWRRSRSNAARATDEGAEARSDAPKSIAGSLLVPADMLSAGTPLDEQLSGDERSRATVQPADYGGVTPGSWPSTDAVHQNPFLAPEAASAGQSARPASRRPIAALLTLLLAAVTAHRRSVRPRRMTRPVALALALFAATALSAVILTRSETASSPPVQASIHGGTTSSLDPLKAAPLAAAANPLAARHTAHRTASNQARRVRAHRASNKHPRTRRASSAAVVPAHYTPPPSTGGSSAGPSDTSGYASSGSTAAPAAQSTAQPSSATSSRPAFGSNGTLGPGSSPNG